MKVTYTSKDGRMRVEVDEDKHTELFKQLAAFQEVFEADDQCGRCNCPDLKFVVRNVDDNDFYELQCTNPTCRAKLQFGVHKKGGSLFPKRFDDEGKIRGRRGWVKYNRETKEIE